MKRNTKVLRASFILALLLPAVLFCLELEDLNPLPVSEYILERKAYVLAYDGERKQARWVYEHLMEENLEKNVDRKGMKFRADPDLPKQLQSQKADFNKSGFDRGHLCPAADANFDEKALKETFYFSNISPQTPSFNRSMWGKLEREVRDLLVQHEELHVYTGPLYLPYEENSKMYVKYEVIGKNHVAVPTHFFKVVLKQTDTQRVPLVAFILPNEEIEEGSELEDFLTTVAKVEQVAGFLFPR